MEMHLNALDILTDNYNNYFMCTYICDFIIHITSYHLSALVPAPELK